MNALVELRSRYAAGELSKADLIERMHEQHRRLFDYSELLRQGDIGEIRITADGVIMTSRHGVQFLVDSVDRRCAPIEALNFSTYEASDAELFWSLCRDGDTILDVGANVGWYALHAAARFPQSAIHAFEPIPQNLRYLRHNLTLNRFANVSVHDCGLAERDGPATFFVYPEGPGGASLANNSGRDSVTTVSASVVRLDQLRLCPDVIKMDVEGGELSALRGSAETLAKHQPALMVEMLRKWTAAHGYHPNDTIAFMNSLGFECRTGLSGRRVSQVTVDETATNFVFLHRQRHADRLT